MPDYPECLSLRRGRGQPSYKRISNKRATALLSPRSGGRIDLGTELRPLPISCLDNDPYLRRPTWRGQDTMANHESNSSTRCATDTLKNALQSTLTTPRDLRINSRFYKVAGRRSIQQTWQYLSRTLSTRMRNGGKRCARDGRP